MDLSEKVMEKEIEWDRERPSIDTNGIKRQKKTKNKKRREKTRKDNRIPKIPK